MQIPFVEATKASQITVRRFGYAKVYHVKRLMRETLLFRTVPKTTLVISLPAVGKWLVYNNLLGENELRKQAKFFA